MPRLKFEVGERVEMRCDHLLAGQRRLGWLAGQVIQADTRMLAVRFDADVFTSNGWPVRDRILWCAHGSRNIRRSAAANQGPELANPD